MEKNVIEVVLQPEEKKKSILILLFKKRKFIILVTLIGLVAGLIVSPVYYLRESKREEEIPKAQRPPIISENVFDRQFLSQTTREREPGNLQISEQLRYDIFLVHRIMNDIIMHLFTTNETTVKTSFEAFQGIAAKKVSLIDSFISQHLLGNVGIFTTKIDTYITQHPYLLVNDDKGTLIAKIQENQSMIDTYHLVMENATDNIISAQILIEIESLNKENKILEELIQGSTANDPDPRGTEIAATQIDALCETLDEVKLELLTMIDQYTAPSPPPSPPPSPSPSPLKVAAIGAVFPCMMFIVAILIVLLLDWWRKFIIEQNNVEKSDDGKE